MDETVRLNLLKRARHLGIGDPKTANLLFIGVEQGGDHKDLHSYEIQEPEFVQWKPFEKKNKPWSPVWTKITRVSCSIRGIQAHREYRKKELFQEGCFELLTDLFPLSKPRKGGWPYHKDLERSEYRDWIDKNIKERYEKIYRFQNSMRNRIASICFGKSNWEDHIKCLQLEDIPYFPVGEGRDTFIVYTQAKTILSPFFGNGALKNAVLDMIILEIRRFEQTN